MQKYYIYKRQKEGCESLESPAVISEVTTQLKTFLSEPEIKEPIRDILNLLSFYKIEQVNKNLKKFITNHKP
jgi:hypothetical protein